MIFRRSLKLLLVVFVLGCCLWNGEPQAQPPQVSDFPELQLNDKDRILILAPHPDDEVIGCGGIIQKALRLNLPIKIVFLTYGDSNQWSFLLYRKHPVFVPNAVIGMGQLRHEEAIAASKMLGVSSDQLVFLGYPDFGTLNIWYSRWGNRKPYRSVLTRRKAVPYKTAFRPGASHKGEDILEDLTQVIGDFKPTKIFVTHPADHNTDHLAAYLFTRVALWDLRMENTVRVYPFLVHYKGWPVPQGLRTDLPLAPPESLKDQLSWVVSPLTSEELNLKLEALKEHRTQYRATPVYLASFLRANELFGDFPVIRLQNEIRHVVPSKGKKEESEMPEELTPEEKADFTSLEWRFVKLEGEDIVLSVKFSKPLSKDVRASVYVFGYRKDKPFGTMPKVHIRLTGMDYSAYDQQNGLSEENITVTRQSNEIIIRIPLSDLGNPQRILTSAQTYRGNVPLDFAAWRTVEMD